MVRPKLLVLIAALLALAWGIGGWFLPGPLAKDTEFTVRNGESFATVADNLGRSGAVSSLLARPVRLRGPCAAARTISSRDE